LTDARAMRERALAEHSVIVRIEAPPAHLLPLTMGAPQPLAQSAPPRGKQPEQPKRDISDVNRLTAIEKALGARPAAAMRVGDKLSPVTAMGDANSRDEPAPLARPTPDRSALASQRSRSTAGAVKPTANRPDAGPSAADGAAPAMKVTEDRGVLRRVPRRDQSAVEDSRRSIGVKPTITQPVSSEGAAKVRPEAPAASAERRLASFEEKTAPATQGASRTPAESDKAPVSASLPAAPPSVTSPLQDRPSRVPTTPAMSLPVGLEFSLPRAAAQAKPAKAK
jgi:hypothetical protein